MKLTIKTKNLDLTPSLQVYIEEKLGTLNKFVQRFDSMGQPELTVEVGRTTRHHRQGEVMRAEINLRLPGAMLRSEDTHDTDARKAIDGAKKKIKLEIDKYKTRADKKSGKDAKRAK